MKFIQSFEDKKSKLKFIKNTDLTDVWNIKNIGKVPENNRQTIN